MDMTSIRIAARAAVLAFLLLASCGDQEKIVSPPDNGGPAADRLFHPNQISIRLRNDGSRDFTADAAVTYRGVVSVFDLGLWIGASVGGSIRVSATSYFGSEFEPVHLGGTDSLALVYILVPGDGPGDDDYDSWPVHEGAPADSSARPRLIGSGTAWTAYDDENPSLHTRFGAEPLGATVRATVWGRARPDSVLLVHFAIENTGNEVWESALLGIWVDADLGNAENDLIGCDLARSMGYTYTSPRIPETFFGAWQPALGVVLLRTPDDAGLYAFPRIWKGDTEPHTAADADHLLQGLNMDGSVYHDSTTGEPTRYTASGDPVSGTGSNEHVPADRRMLLSTGPLTVNPGTEVELTYAIVVSRHATALGAVTRLRAAADAAAADTGLWDVFGPARLEGREAQR